MIDLSKYDKNTMFIFSDGSVGTNLTVNNMYSNYKYNIEIISCISNSIRVPYILTFNEQDVWKDDIPSFYIVEII